MFGKPQWFKRRKYTGWGLTPATWQGWIYILVIVAIFAAIQQLPISRPAAIIATIVVAAIIVVDVIHIMVVMKKDERETMHEAIAERNAAWAMVIIIGIGVAYEAGASAISGIFAVDPFLLAAIGAALIAKIASNIYLDKTS